MNKCFVIQIFDNDKFDKRFVDVFKPAIEASELEAYRIDNDPSVRVLIDDIEKNIKESQICFADITSDNPNVWYELGFAFASGKDVVMVCSEEREGNFPFDIQHRKIIKYKTSSTSDFETLKENIITTLESYKKTNTTVKKLRTSSVVGIEGLKSHEISILILITENQYVDNDFISLYQLRNEMKQAGYTDIATSVGVKVLRKNNLIEISTEIDEWNDNKEFIVCRLTKDGENWIIDNQDKLVFKTGGSDNSENDLDIDNIPF